MTEKTAHTNPKLSSLLTLQELTYHQGQVRTKVLTLGFRVSLQRHRSSQLVGGLRECRPSTTFVTFIHLSICRLLENVLT